MLFFTFIRLRSCAQTPCFRYTNGIILSKCTINTFSYGEKLTYLKPKNLIETCLKKKMISKKHKQLKNTQMQGYLLIQCTLTTVVMLTN